MKETTLAQKILILRSEQAKQNHTLAKALELLPNVIICYDDFRLYDDSPPGFKGP